MSKDRIRKVIDGLLSEAWREWGWEDEGEVEPSDADAEVFDDVWFYVVGPVLEKVAETGFSDFIVGASLNPMKREIRFFFRDGVWGEEGYTSLDPQAFSDLVGKVEELGFEATEIAAKKGPSLRVKW